MSESTENFFTVTKKPEGAYGRNRILMVVGYIVFGLAYFFGLFMAHLYAIMAFIVLLEWILVFFTWRYVSIEYRYDIESSNVNFYTIYGGRSKKLILTRHIKDFEVIAPLDEAVKTDIKNGVYKLLIHFSRLKKVSTAIMLLIRIRTMIMLSYALMGHRKRSSSSNIIILKLL